MHCPNCQAHMLPWVSMPIDAKKNEETRYGNVLRCEGCGLGRIEHLPEPDEIAEFYDLGAYYTHGESHMREVPSTLLDRLIVRLAWQADQATPFDVDALAQRLPPGGSVLDIGCGDGELLEAFRDRGFQVTGVDPDPKSRAFAGSKGLLILAGTAEAPPEELEGAEFDLVIMSHSLEHCRDPLAAVATLRRLMKRGGLAYVEVPNAGCRHFETFRQCSEMFDAPRHLWFFTGEALAQIVDGAGLAVDGWHFNGFTRLFTPTWRAWECEIFDRLEARGMSRGARRHSRLSSVDLLARSAFAAPQRKYDSVGIVARLVS